MDELVASAIAHWAPRFTTNGVAVSDFERITGGLERWSDWCAAWCAAAAEHRGLAEEAQAEGRLRSAGQHYAQAAVYYHFAKFLFVQDLDQMRAAHAEAVRCLDAALPHLDPPGRRVEIPFDGARMVGVLRLPSGAGPHPAVVMVPGLDSTKEEFRTTEALFLERGVATFSVDGPGQGESEYDLPIRADWEKPGAAILDAVGRLDSVDPGRLAVWGVSLGGYYAPRIAAGDPRVRACVALAGPYNLGAAWDTLPTLTREAFRVRSHLKTEDQAREYAQTLSIEGHAQSIGCPLLVVAGKLDRLFPWQDAERLVAEAAGPATLLLLGKGNHGCMNVAAQHRNKTADWVAAQLAEH
jgi:2,6-dihydroxypseudooxynicotine hydrolase